MWSHYRRSFFLIQLVILMVTWTVFRAAENRIDVTLFFFLTMQVGSVIGSVWAARLRRKLAQRPW
jgi:hypothetical protein